MSDSMIKRVERAMGDTLIPGSSTVTARYVLSKEMISYLARAAITASAAPDMLLALKAMTEEWVDYMTINNLAGDPWSKHNMRLAKLAIEKAESPADERDGGTT